MPDSIRIASVKNIKTGLALSDSVSFCVIVKVLKNKCGNSMLLAQLRFCEVFPLFRVYIRLDQCSRTRQIIISVEVRSAFTLLLYSYKKKDKNSDQLSEVGKFTHALRILTFVYLEPTWCLK